MVNEVVLTESASPEVARLTTTFESIILGRLPSIARMNSRRLVYPTGLAIVIVTVCVGSDNAGEPLTAATGAATAAAADGSDTSQ
jgi:hypothetical protein